MKPKAVSTLVLMLTLGAATLRTARAQTIMLKPGDTLRIEFLAGKSHRTWLQTRFLWANADTLAVSRKGVKAVIPCKQVNRLYVARGRRSHFAKGLRMGALIGGAGLGLAAAISAATSSEDDWFVPSPTEAFLGGAIGGTLIGGLLGGIIGYGHITPRWVELPLDSLSTALARSGANQQLPPQIPTPTATTGRQRHPGDARLRPAAGRPQPGPSKAKPVSLWSIHFALGSSFFGPMKSIEDYMRAHGFGDTTPGFFFPGRAHPYSDSGISDGLNLTLALRRTLPDRWKLGFQAGRSVIGRTVGWDRVLDYFKLEYRVVFVAATGYHALSDAIDVGFGPALASVKTKQFAAPSYSLDTFTTDRFGALLEFRYCLTPGRPSLAEISLQYLLIPSVTIGPFYVQNDEYRTTLPPTRINVSHFRLHLAFGFGI